MPKYSELYHKLEQYCSFGPYPFHMPGHKRSLCPVEGLPYDWDVTEVPGTDDLHEAEGILKAAMDRTAEVWGAQKTWYLVNGSTCGLLAGIRALAPYGSTVIAARNCHKAVYHAMELGNLQVRWLTPRLLPEGICGPIQPEAVREALEAAGNPACVILTSPTYEGILSDIPAIAELCHERRVPLLVDEAHGAHLGLFHGWPESALHCGADVIVQSVHKTLPSLTQTALLHLGKGSLADPQEVERQLGIFETSSPSYPLLVSIDGCTEYVIREGEAGFARWLHRLENFDESIQCLKHLSVLGHSQKLPHVFDPGKLPIFTGRTALHGGDLAGLLRDRYGMETEMSQGDICLAMTGLGDSQRSMEALAQALLEIDSTLSTTERQPAQTLPEPGETVIPLGEAVRRPVQEIPWEDALGKISGESIWAYPPGIPLILPGERVTEAFLRVVRDLRQAGTALHHSRCRGQGMACLENHFS